METRSGELATGLLARGIGKNIRVGILLEPPYELRLQDEDGLPMGDGEVGEIVVRGPSVTRQLLKVARPKVVTAESDFVVLRRTEAGTEIQLAGRYRDRLIKREGAGRFLERRAVALARSDS